MEVQLGSNQLYRILPNFRQPIALKLSTGVNPVKRNCYENNADLKIVFLYFNKIRI